MTRPACIRIGLAIVSLLIAPLCACADEASVRVSLSLHDAKMHFLIGEPIVLDLVFEAVGDPVVASRLRQDYALDLDQIAIAPVSGVYPWLNEKRRFVPAYGGDSLEVRTAVTNFRMSLTLNDRYRFDRPGTYTVRVTTRRVAPVTTDAVTFTVVEPGEAEEDARVERIVAAFRAATNERESRRLADQLAWLPDAAATRAKLELAVGPRAFDPYLIRSDKGLWIARDRAAVVARLEQAIVDRDQDFATGSPMPGTLVALKASLEIPFDGDASQPLPRGAGMVVQAGLHDATMERIAADYTRRIAETLPQRTGKSRIDAAQRVLWSRGRSPSPMDDPAFLAAREVVIVHFEDVDPYNVDTNLNQYGRYLEDPRLIPKLEALLDQPGHGPLVGNRGPALAMLGRLDPSAAAGYVAKEACMAEPALLDRIVRLPVVATPEADDCLAAKLTAQSAIDATRPLQMRLDFSTLPYVARFASDRLLPQVEALYPALQDTPHNPSAVGAALVYLMRWNPTRYRPLLEAAADDPKSIALTFQMTALASPPTDGIRAFFRERIAAAPAAMTQNYIDALGQIGEAEDMRFLQQRLDALRASPTMSNETTKQTESLEQAIRRGGTTKPQPAS